ncbi:MAG: caspase family protein [Smithellaceae bacterium]
MKHKLFFLISITLMLFFSSTYFCCPEAKALKREAAGGKTSQSSSSTETRGVQVKGKSEAVSGSFYDKSYAVIIGINNYEKWPSLEYAVNDAKAMERKLKSLGFETTILINQNANKDNILKILGDELPRKVGRNDRVIIFFAGHGQTEQLADDSQMGYIIPVDADTGNIFSTAISMDQVRIFSRRLKAKHVLYLIDSCYAGLGLTRSGSIPASEKDYLRKITTRKAHQMLVAGGKGELAHEEGSHGVFTKYVLEALDGAADRDEKGYITFSDISSYVKPKVSRQTKNSQVPQYGNIDGEGEFVFIAAATPAAMPAVNLKPSVQTENEQLKIEQEKQRLEQEKADLATQREQFEEQKRLAKEREKLEAERKAMEAERAKLSPQRSSPAGSYSTRDDARRSRFASVQSRVQSAAENLQGVTIRIIHVPRRKADAERASEKLGQLGAKVHLYETNDSGNAAFMGKLITKNGYENYSSLIINTLRDVEGLTMDNAASYQVWFKDGQAFNLWIAR